MGDTYSIAQHVDDMIAFIEQIDPGPVDLMGHSRGGHVSFRLAQRRPDLLRRLILAEPGGELDATLDPAAKPGPSPLAARFAASAEKIVAGDIDGGLAFFMAAVEGPGAWARLPATSKQLLRDNAMTLIGQVRDNRPPFSKADAEAIRTPTLFIGGGNTKGMLAHRAAYARSPCEGVETAIIPNTTHPMFEQAPQKFCEVVLEFARGIKGVRVVPAKLTLATAIRDQVAIRNRVSANCADAEDPGARPRGLVNPSSGCYPLRQQRYGLAPDNARRNRHEADRAADRRIQPGRLAVFPGTIQPRKRSLCSHARRRASTTPSDRRYGARRVARRAPPLPPISTTSIQLLGAHPRMIDPVEQIFGEKVYMHQYKINAKSAFTGDVWQWHQDYGTWKRDDGMPQPRAMNIAIFLDEVMPINGPLMLVPRSQHAGDLKASHDLQTTSYPLWTLDEETVTRLVREGGIVAPTGKAGGLLMFHGNLVHGSAGNITPYPRKIVYLTLNAVSNYIRNPTRPEYIAHRDFTPIETVSDDALLQLARLRRQAAE